MKLRKSKFDKNTLMMTVSVNDVNSKRNSSTILASSNLRKQKIIKMTPNND